METWNRLTVAKGVKMGDNGGKTGKGLIKGHIRMTCGQGQQCGIDCGNRVWDGQRSAKREKLGTW